MAGDRRAVAAPTGDWDEERAQRLAATSAT